MPRRNRQYTMVWNMVWLWFNIEMVGYAIMHYLLLHSLNLLFNIFIYVRLNVKKITMQWCFLLTGTGLKGLISLFSFIEHNFTFQCTDIHAKKYHHNNTPINPWFIFQSRMVVKTLQSNDHWHSEHMWNDWYGCFYFDSWQLAVFNGRWFVLETLDPLIN